MSPSPRRRPRSAGSMRRTAARAAVLAVVWLLATGSDYEWGGPAGRGVRELKKKENAKAIRSLREGAAELPRSAAVRYDQGLAYAGLGSADSAATAYEEALRLRGNHARSAAAYNLGNQAMHAKKYADAASLYRESLRLDPSRADAKKNLEEAIRMAREMPKQPPQGGGGQDKKNPSQGSAPRPPGGEQKKQGSSQGAPPPNEPNQTPGEKPQLGGATPSRSEAEHWLDALEAERKAARLRDKKGAEKETGQRDW
jgi:tetratricopeptide (TPR) repeat protein